MIASRSSGGREVRRSRGGEGGGVGEVIMRDGGEVVWSGFELGGRVVRVTFSLEGEGSEDGAVDVDVGVVEVDEVGEDIVCGF